MNDPILGVLMPLEMGNYWEFDAVNFHGRVVDSIRYEILDQIHHSGPPTEAKLLVASWYSRSGPPEGNMEIFSNVEDGTRLSGLIIATDTVVANFLTYPYPASPGQVFYSYNFRRKDGSDELEVSDSTRYELVATDALIESPVGKFRTYSYKYFVEPPVPDVANGSFVYLYFAPGIGLVAKEIWSESRDQDKVGNPSFQYRLTDYCVRAASY